MAGLQRGRSFAQAVQEKLQATAQVVKRNGAHTFAVLPQRWAVERSFGWLEKCRRLWKNCERKINTSRQFVHVAFLTLFAPEIVNRFLEQRFEWGDGLFKL